jgi:hypothetical protein
MTATETKNWEVAKVEYENALAQYRHYTSLRGQDMMFVTTVQAAVLTIIGPKLPNLDFAYFLLSVVAFFALLVGINSQWRLSAYMAGFMQRAMQIETEYGMSFLSVGKREVDKKKLLRTTAFVFSFYHLIFILAWIVIWIWNLLKALNLLI